MEPLSSRTATNWKEGRRLRAVELFEQAWQQKHIAQALGVTPGAVCQWLKKARKQGKAALRQRKGGGPKPKLRPEQREQLPALLEPGAEAFGFRGQAWTAPRVAQVIGKHFGVSYSSRHVSRLLGEIGLSRQKPERRAKERNEQAIEAWKTERWPALKKGR